ncbi:GntR family transcriptional regulator [Cupriavidus sp. USMAHM13]|uniref:GntR family transcriptional regulator n=1 Tax=Cupriavidus malaysiensis TaxID=367825 RepID=A0A1D9HYQ2_9BURK|nr:MULTISPECIES: PLP-dependent aminotransferase family protein [Cupriavidus]AOY98508.1 GntR family transcriptional regulator [Cupriavidus sp. USMAHM13]AOZ04938.1 GntR family transcriptional regulator [Cupriavidus malaysiensis]
MIPLQLHRSRRGGETLTEQIVNGVAALIERRALRAGAALPSVRRFAMQHGVSTFTVAEAYARLTALGYLSARAGSGYTVAHRHAPAGLAPAPHWQTPELNAAWLLSDVFADHSVPIKAGAGWLPGDWLNEEGLHQAMRAASRVPAAQVSGYGHPFGFGALREHVAAGLGQYGMPVQARQVVLTQGATQALDLVVRTLLRPGDTVLVEAPCYCNLLQILRLAGLRVVGVPRGAAGLDTDALDDAIRAHAPRMLFVNTVLQNPTGASLTSMNAHRVLQLAERHRLLVVEDDIYRELAPAGSPMLAAMDGLSHVIYINGFSKTIAPSLRVGYLAASPELAKALARTKMAVGLTSSEVTERLVYSVLTSGHYGRHVAALAERLRAQQDRIAETMERHGLELLLRPEGGMFAWARLRPQDGPRAAPALSGNRLARLALEHGVWLAPGSYFEPDEADSPWIRFNVATSDAPGLWRFFDAMRAAEPATRAA